MKNLLMTVMTFCALSVFGQNAGSGVQREGFVIGFGIGGGVISLADSQLETDFDEVQGAFSLPNLKIGWMLNERTALLATFPGMIYEQDGKDRSFESFLPSIQYWLDDRWWLNAGAGLAMDFPAFYEVDDFKDEDWNFGCAVAFSMGYELIQTGKFALDLQSRVHLGRTYLGNDFHRDAAAFEVGIGFNWY